jgi:hypothetical protein
MRLTPFRALRPPAPRQYLPFALIWLAIALGVALVVVLLRLPERMECRGGGARRVHCEHGLLSPGLWRRP